MSDESYERVSQELFTDVKEFEGTADLQGSDKWEEISGHKSFKDGKFLPYKDTDSTWAIGYGIKIDEDDIDHFEEGITKEEADSMLTERLHESQEQASRLIYGYEDLPQDVQEVLTDLTFNMGYGTISEEFPGFLEAISDRNYPLAMAHLKFKSPSSLGLREIHRDDTGDKFSEYYSTHKERGTYNLNKLQRAYQDSLDTSTDDGVFNMLLDKDVFE